MDKNAIKKYAVWARRELISRVSQRAALYEISDKGFGDASTDSVLGRVMSAEEKRQRQALIAQIREKGYEQVMEEIAYTWFNRFIALRFMEVNGYLPSRVRVFTDDENNFKPQILDEAINMELDGLDMEKVYALKNANDDDALFKYMIIVQCNALSSILPGMFQHISDYTELLFPDNLLREGSVIEQMVSMIPAEDWTDQVQIIGWLYQYYNTEPKDKVFADLKKNIKISKENIPAATQLFTPDWIVRYMVENSLGRLWLEGHPDDELKATWKYFLDEADQEPDVQAQLAEIRKEYAALRPEDILAIDPCQGSGHILAYMFDVLVQIYESYGYTAREAASSIVEHNIWGLDIDDRAAQLAYFSVMMKARQYDRRFFSRGIQPHVFEIPEFSACDEQTIDYLVGENKRLRRDLEKLFTVFHKAKQIGSLLDVSGIDCSEISRRIEEIKRDDNPNLYSIAAINTVEPLLSVYQALNNKYHVVATNPPYLSSSGMNSSLLKYVKKHFPETKADLYAAFIEACSSFTASNGFFAMITMQSWMFIGSYESFRKRLVSLTSIVNLLQLGIKAFEEIGNDVVQTTAFCIRKNYLRGYRGCYHQLTTHNRDEKLQQFFDRTKQFVTAQDEYSLVESCPIAYWMPPSLARVFATEKKLGELAETRIGVQTGNNELFVRFWTEVQRDRVFYSETPPVDLSKYKWFPYTKGGSYRKWYGNNDLVINWENEGEEIRKYNGFGSVNDEFYYQPCITWGLVSSAGLNFRYVKDCSHVIGNGGPMANAHDERMNYYLLGLLNSCVTQYISNMLNPTINMSTGTVSAIPVMFEPVVFDRVVELVRENIAMCKEDYDEKETSIDFTKHPLLRDVSTIEAAYEYWRNVATTRFQKLKSNEYQLNSLFIELYGLENVLSPEVNEKYVSVTLPNLTESIKSLLSFAIGCIFGRYSLQSNAFLWAGNKVPLAVSSSSLFDVDNIIPICDDEYFEDDIVTRVVEFIKTVYGADTLEENLSFISRALGGKGSSREALRSYFCNDFFGDHCNMYSVFLAGKRPIYWLFDSGKKNGFKCLIYMHRYQPDTIARIRTDYVHEQQSRYRTAIADLESRIASAGTGERVKISKQLAKLQDQAEELRVYEEKIHHLADQMIRIDLDDGVKHNYAIFQDVLAKIK